MDLDLNAFEQFVTSIKEIRFSELPDFNVLDQIADINKEVCFHFPTGSERYLFDPYGLGDWSGRVLSASIETDVFCDHDIFWEFGGLQHLDLHCHNPRVANLDHDDFIKVWDAISEMKNLRRITLNLNRTQQSFQDQVIEGMHFREGIQVDVIATSGKGPGRRRKLT